MQTPPGPFPTVTHAVGETSRAEWGQARGQATFHQDALQALSEKAALELELKVGINKLQGQKPAPEPSGKRNREPRVSRETALLATGWKGWRVWVWGFSAPENILESPKG